MRVLSESVTDTEFFGKIFIAVISELGQPSKIEVGVEIVSPEEIQRINREQRNVDNATDVLSFPTQNLSAGEKLDLSRHAEDIDPETGELYLGDILICREVAAAQAAEYGHSERREVGYLFCHALLHLFGFDHMTESDRSDMRLREEKIMNQIHLTRED